MESVLGEHPAVGSVAVIVREDSPGDKRLVAYCVLRGGGSATGAELIAYLKSRLPEYMVSSWRSYSTNSRLIRAGKLDRGALPLPESTAGEGCRVRRDR